MKVKELPDIIEVGTVVKSEVQGQQGVVSKVILERTINGVTRYVRFGVTWMDGHTSDAYQHENSFEVMYEPV